MKNNIVFLTVVLIAIFIETTVVCSSHDSLSYGPDVLPEKKTSTDKPIETTTKESFFSGIKKLFGGGKNSGSTTTTTVAPLNNERTHAVSFIRSTTPHSISSTTATPSRVPFEQTTNPSVKPLPTATPSRVPLQQTTSSSLKPLPTATPSRVPLQQTTSSSLKPLPTATPSRVPLQQTTSSSLKPLIIATTSQAPPDSSFVLANKDFPPLAPPRNAGKTPDKKFDIHPTKKSTKTQLDVNEEILTLTENLLSKDTNNQNQYVSVNLQGKTKSTDRTDEAPDKLLEVNDKAFESPTIAKMKLLFNNYELDTSVNEYVTPLERKEENEFMDAIMATTVIRTMMQFLQNKGIVTADPKNQRDYLKTLWFTLYSRGGGRIGSSAFEHVFLNEVKNNTVIGMHNWVYYHEEEKLGHADYKGYIRKVDLGNKGSILKYRFNYNGLEKYANTLFIGTSPELEMALYTICFAVRADQDCSVSLNQQKFNIVTHTWKYRGKQLIGSAYPEI